MNFWHIQLHPADRNSFPAQKVLSLLKENEIIGMGEGWENDGSQPTHFSERMQIGDIVAVRDGGTPIALVQVTGDCKKNEQYSAERWFDLIRDVKILSDKPPQYSHRFFDMTSRTLQREVTPAFVRFWFNSLMEEEKMNKYKTLLESCHNLILTGAPGTGKTFLANTIACQLIWGETHSITEIENDVNLLNTWQECHDFVQFHPSYDYTDFVEGLRPTSPDENGNVGFRRQDGIFKSFCKKALRASLDNGQDNFDESWKKLVEYLNENDFIQVTNLSGSGVFEVELNEYGTGLASHTYASEQDRIDHNKITGRTKFFNKEQLYRIYRGLSGVPNGGHDNYRKAIIKMMKEKEQFGLLEYKAGNQDSTNHKKYVFIIDEINRGDIAKIFGELFFAIDPGYRGVKGRVKTQYSNLLEEDDVFYDGFYVPENVYIIGTMNDIDRNVESMDFAIRRRFTWFEVKPDNNLEMWEDETNGILAYKEEALKHMDAINKTIRKVKGLGPAYQLGASYFLKLREYEGDFGKLWNFHIKLLLCEYLRGLPDAEKTLTRLENAWQHPETVDAQENNSVEEATQE